MLTPHATPLSSDAAVLRALRAMKRHHPAIAPIRPAPSPTGRVLVVHLAHGFAGEVRP